MIVCISVEAAVPWVPSEPFHVVDANTMETIYTIDGLITKGSAAVSTAYATEENDHQVYIYMVPYNCNTDENFWIISDKQGQTEPDYETAKTVGNNYCSQTVAVAPNGYLVWYQDGWVSVCLRPGG